MSQPIEDVRDTLRPVLDLIKQLNNQIKSEELDGDTIKKLSTSMGLASIKLNKIIKDHNIDINGGVLSKEDP